MSYFEKKVSIFYPSAIEEHSERIRDYVDMFPVENAPFESKHTPNDKRIEFMQFINDSKAEILIAWKGGIIDENNSEKFSTRSSLELINKLTDDDWKHIKDCNKSIVGLSDVSYLLYEMQKRNILCFYGPNYGSHILVCPDDYLKTELQYLKNALTFSKQLIINFKSEELTSQNTFPWVINQGICEGRLVGGNLDTLLSYIKYVDSSASFIKERDILFIEEVDPIYNIDGKRIYRNNFTFEKFRKLKEIGIFDRINGLIIGKSKQPIVIAEFDDTLMDEQYAITELIQQLHIRNIPIIANVACGHDFPSITLPMGKHAILNTQSMTLTVKK